MFLNLIFSATGRSSAHAFCSHSSSLQPDVYETNARLIMKYGFLMKNIVFASFLLPDPCFQILATRSWPPDSGYKPGYQILATRSWLPYPGYQILASISWQPDPGYQILATMLYFQS